MRKNVNKNSQPTDGKQERGWGSIRADEVMPLREAARRLGWCEKSRRHALKDGLNVIEFGRYQYVRGSDIHEFFQRLGNCQQQTLDQRTD